ncbi:transmembrane protein 243-like [Halichondria panicea]|uniref:transmembrane protein 243-like n=1 Tax=Halichondria panicea TaxID=6063 RepID=UPI00312B5B3E
MEPDTQPLFGETRRKDKIINIVIAIITAIIVFFTVLMGVVSSVFLSHQKCLRLYKQSQAYCVYPVDLVFCVLIVLLLLPQIIVAYWYRRGELEPKFRRLIYYNAIVTILLCVCGNLYFFQLGFEPYPQPTVSPSTQSPITSKLNY